MKVLLGVVFVLGLSFSSFSADLSSEQKETILTHVDQVMMTPVFCEATCKAICQLDCRIVNSEQVCEESCDTICVEYCN